MLNEILKSKLFIVDCLTQWFPNFFGSRHPFRTEFGLMAPLIKLMTFFLDSRNPFFLS